MSDEQHNQDQDEGFPWPDLLRSFGVDADNDVEHFFEGAVSFDTVPPDTDDFQVQLSEQTLEFERRHAQRGRVSSGAGGELGSSPDSDKRSEIMANEKDTNDTMSAENEEQLPSDTDDQSRLNDAAENPADELGWDMPAAKPTSPRPSRAERKPSSAAKRASTKGTETDRPAPQPAAGLAGWDEIVSSLGVDDRTAGGTGPHDETDPLDVAAETEARAETGSDAGPMDHDDETDFDSENTPAADRGRRRRRRGRRGRGERSERDVSRDDALEESPAPQASDSPDPAPEPTPVPGDEWDGFGAGLLGDEVAGRRAPTREYAPVENFASDEGQGSVVASDEDDGDDEESGLVTWTDDDANEYVSFEVEELDPHGRSGRSRGRRRPERPERPRRDQRDDQGEPPRKPDPAPARELEPVEARDSRDREDLDDEEDRPRRRSRRRRGSGRGDSDRSDDVRRDRPSRRNEPRPEAATRRDADDEGDDDDGDSRDKRDRKPRNLPTWNETIDVIVQSNLSQRKKSPGSGGGGGGGGRRRRGSGRGGRR